MDTQLALPVPADALRLVDHGSVVEVRRGGYTITAFPQNDLGLRNLAVVALTESRVPAKAVAELFGLSQAQVSRIRSDYRAHGSAGLAKRMGRPPLLNEAQIRQARLWAGQGVRHGEIARRLGVSRP
jgi:transposase